jgi:hypothetical protein
MHTQYYKLNLLTHFQPEFNTIINQNVKQELALHVLLLVRLLTIVVQVVHENNGDDSGHLLELMRIFTNYFTVINTLWVYGTLMKCPMSFFFHGGIHHFWILPVCCFTWDGSQIHQRIQYSMVCSWLPPQAPSFYLIIPLHLITRKFKTLKHSSHRSTNARGSTTNNRLGVDTPCCCNKFVACWLSSN